MILVFLLLCFQKLLEIFFFCSFFARRRRHSNALINSLMLICYNLPVRKIRAREVVSTKSHEQLVSGRVQAKPGVTTLSTTLFIKLKTNISSAFTCCRYSLSLISFVFSFWGEKPRLWPLQIPTHRHRCTRTGSRRGEAISSHLFISVYRGPVSATYQIHLGHQT